MFCIRQLARSPWGPSSAQLHKKRGRVVSAHSTKELADQAAKKFGGKNPADVVEIATYVLAGDRANS